MTIFTDRDLERVASLRMNWRREFLLEIVRLRQQRNIAGHGDRLPTATPDNTGSTAMGDGRHSRATGHRAAS